MRLSEAEREEARRALRLLLDATVSPAALRAPAEDRSHCAATVWRGLADLGWLGITVESDRGGLGLGVGDLAVLYEELGRCAAPAFVAGSMIATQALSVCDDGAWKARWLPRMLAGEARVALPVDFGFERESRVTLVGDDASNLALIPCKDGARRGFRLHTISAAVRGAPALDRTRRMFEAPEQVESDTLWFTAEQWSRLADHAARALAADSVGGCAFILQTTVEYLGMRKQFGRVIGSFQALKHRAADWKVVLEACRALTAAAFSETGDDAPDPASVKAYVCDAYATIAGDAVQLHGGIGFTWEHVCHIYLKRAKLNQALLGGQTANMDRAARRILGESAHA